MIPLRLSVFFVPFAVKGLTNSKSAAERFKVRGLFVWLCVGSSFVFSYMMLPLKMTPG